MNSIQAKAMAQRGIMVLPSVESVPYPGPSSTSLRALPPPYWQRITWQHIMLFLWANLLVDFRSLTAAN